MAYHDRTERTSMIQIDRSGYELWRRCPRRFFFERIAKLTPDAPYQGITSSRLSPDLELGTAYHFAMELALKGEGYVACKEAAVSSIEKAGLSGREWAGASIGYHQEATDYYKFVASGLAWVAATLAAPHLLRMYTLQSTEPELAPYSLDTYPNLAMASRPDAVFTDVTGGHILGSWKTCSTYSQKLALAALYDTQGLSESVSYHVMTGVWPSVQMVYAIKGKREKKNVPYVMYDGPLTRAYFKEYVKGGSSWSPRYTSGWTKRPTSDYPGGPLLYWETVLLDPLNMEHLPYSIPPVQTRSMERAYQWLTNNLFPAMHAAYSRPPVMEAFHAEESVDSCYAYSTECFWRGTCHNLIQISDIPNLTHRTPHHKDIYDSSDSI
jgi:hypothetical protein